MSERRADLETRNAGADLPDRWGRPLLVEPRATRLDQSRRGTGDGMHGRRTDRQHGKPQRWDNAPNRTPARDRPGRRGVTDRFVVCAGQRDGQEGSSPSGARMRGAVSESGGNSSLAEERKVWRTLTGHEGESRIQPRRTCSHRTRSFPEGRVSAVRRNPKGMRRSTGPQSMGATP